MIGTNCEVFVTKNGTYGRKTNQIVVQGTSRCFNDDLHTRGLYKFKTIKFWLGTSSGQIYDKYM